MQFYCQNTIRSKKDNKLCLPYANMQYHLFTMFPLSGPFAEFEFVFYWFLLVFPILSVFLTKYHYIILTDYPYGVFKLFFLGYWKIIRYVEACVLCLYFNVEFIMLFIDTNLFSITLVIYHTNCICKACWVVFFFQNGRLILIVSEPIRYNLVCMLKDYIRNTDLDLWRYIVE
jgi:hypothetical protein